MYIMISYRTKYVLYRSEAILNHQVQIMYFHFVQNL